MTSTLVASGVALAPVVPALNFAPELLLKAQKIKVVFFDVDGVLTDGGLYFGEYQHSVAGATVADSLAVAGETLKRFNTLDGHGLKLLQRVGITPAVITGRDSVVLRARLQALGIVHAHFGTEDKRPAAEATLKTLGLGWSEAACMGDDWPDLPVMRRVALSCAPANAHIEVRALATYVTQARGGDGAVRECCDLLLVASGRYAGLLQAFAQ
jgi:3-deoxy-D-manno-octulosonate 8-phosphate phosphatase (KDO 8-P phosphatase)